MLLIKCEDLKNDITFVVTFEHADDMLCFFSKYNPNSIHILQLMTLEDEKHV